MENYSVKEVKTYLEMIDCYDIRAVVFIEEQKVTPKEEIDGLDKEARHFLLYKDKVAIGTLRLFTNSEKKSFHIGRVAILKEYRHQEAGYYLMKSVIDLLKKDHTGYTINIEAQVHAMGFYTKLGFKPVDGKVFLDANIPHQKMYLTL